MYDLALAGKPAVLVPYPYATADHQAKNAPLFEQAGAALVVLGHGARRACRGSFASCSPTKPRLAAMARADAAVAGPHAADEIAEELIALAGR